ncbi:MAG: sigma-54-dependent Fis family transcriptional regulator [Candidatus Melainabacteria bacterium]|nr:MAG: sigma-54-dependent Fis family transcriptional regulator [Candidatus Melainabacteria bacterium]
MARILVLHDLFSTSGILTEMLESRNHRIVEADSLSTALGQHSKEPVEMIFIDQQSDADSVSALLSAIKEEKSFCSMPVIVVTSTAKSEEVIEAMRLGAFDHLSTPVSADELDMVIERAIVAPKLEPASNVTQSDSESFLVGLSTVMRRVEKQIGIAAACNATVLIQGETGTGKDTVARAIHRHSQHKDNPLTIIDCTAVPEDYEAFESLSPGAQGTVILDEIGDLNAQTQAMLVRALKERLQGSDGPRIIATTQYDLVAMVKEKRFREDLFYRLNVLPISLPPLRDRGSDILSLAEAFLLQARPNAAKRLSSSASKALLDYKWPGNVRELENLMYHLTFSVRAESIDASDLSMIVPVEAVVEGEESFLSMDYYSAMSALEKRLLERALHQANGSRAEAARLLGINRQLLYSKLKAHGLMN